MDTNSLFSYQGGSKWMPETWIWIALRGTKTVGHFYYDFIEIHIVKQVQIVQVKQFNKFKSWDT